MIFPERTLKDLAAGARDELARFTSVQEMCQHTAVLCLWCLRNIPEEFEYYDTQRKNAYQKYVQVFGDSIYEFKYECVELAETELVGADLGNRFQELWNDHLSRYKKAEEVYVAEDLKLRMTLLAPAIQAVLASVEKP